jgi:alpha-beta hydrolase superfamily lysophospholipase
MTALPLTRTLVDPSGIEITFYEWPVAKPKAVIQLVHGLGEHARRYDHVSAELNRHGYSVYADDHRGHGQTGASMIDKRITKSMGQLGPGGMRATINQIHELTDLIHIENPESPLFLFGHSLGAMISQKLINQHSADYRGVILSGSTLMLPGVAKLDGDTCTLSRATSQGYIASPVSSMPKMEPQLASPDLPAVRAKRRWVMALETLSIPLPTGFMNVAPAAISKLLAR